MRTLKVVSYILMEGQQLIVSCSIILKNCGVLPAIGFPKKLGEED